MWLKVSKQLNLFKNGGALTYILNAKVSKSLVMKVQNQLAVHKFHPRHPFNAPGQSSE